MVNLLTPPTEITDVIVTESITNYERVKAFILSEPGQGKSWLLATARKPIYIADCDDRAASLNGKPGLHIKTYKDIDANSPQAWANLESDIGTLEWLKSENKLPYKTVGIDSLTYLLKWAQNQMMKDDVSTFKSKQINGKVYKTPFGWNSITYPQKMLEGLFNRIVALNVDLIVTAHIRREKASDSTEENPKFTGKYTIDPQNLKMLLPSFNERWFMKDDFKVQVHPDYEFNAVTALNLPEGLQEPNIEQMLKAHAGRIYPKNV